MELDDTRQINEDMNLDEAREIARVWRAGETTPRYFPFVQYALLILDDRITELEAQRDELVGFCKMAINACPFPCGTAAAQIKLDEILAKASDKEDKR